MDFRIATLKQLLGRGHLCSGRIHDPRLAVQLLQYFNKTKSQPVSALQPDASKLEESTQKFKEYYGVSLRLPEEDRYLGFETLKQRTEDFVRHLSQKDISLYEDI